MVGDRVQARFMSAVFFTTVAAFVVRQTLVTLFIYNPVAQNPAAPALVTYEPSEDGPRAVVETGSLVSPTLKVRVTDTTGHGAAGQKVALFALPDDHSVMTNAIQGLSGTSMDYTLFAPKGRIEFPSPVPVSMQLPALRGFTAVTASSGVASFPGLTFDTALSRLRYGLWSLVVANAEQAQLKQNATEPAPGTRSACPLGVDASGRLVALDDRLWRATDVGQRSVDSAGTARTQWTQRPVTASGSLAERLGVEPDAIASCVVSSSPIVLSVRSSVGSVEFLVKPPPSAKVGAAWDPQPRALVRDSSGIPLAGKRVLLIPRTLSTSELLFYEHFSTGLLQTPALLEGALSEPSDMFGRADWSGLRVTAAGANHVLLATVCDGAIGSAPTLPLESPVARVDIDTQPSSSVVEGARIAAQPRVRLLDGNGKPVSGMRATAFLRTEAGVTTHTGAAPNSLRGLNAVERGSESLGRTKYLSGIFSSLSDSAGMARFHNLSFTGGGEAGEYTLVFGVAGVFSEATAPIIVTAAVSKVQLQDVPQSMETVTLSTGVCNWGCAGLSRRWVFNATGQQPPWGDGPAGILHRVPSVRVLDKLGRPIAGKLPRVTATAVECDPTEHDAVGTNAAVHLFPTEDSAHTDGSGRVDFHRGVLPGLTSAGTQALFGCIANTRCQPSLRFVAARNCTYRLRFAVDGVQSESWLVRATNLDNRTHTGHTAVVPAYQPRPRPQGVGPYSGVTHYYGAYYGADTRCSYVHVASAPTQAMVGTPMDPIKVTVHNSMGQFISGVKVTALLVNSVNRVGVRPPNATGLAVVDQVVATWAQTNPYVLAATVGFPFAANTFPNGVPLLGEAVTGPDGVAILSGLTIASAAQGWAAIRVVTSLQEYERSPHPSAANFAADTVCDSGRDVVVTVRNHAAVTAVSRPQGCAVGAPCKQPLQVRVTDSGGAPVGGTPVTASLLIGPRGQGIPSYVLQDLVFNSFLATPLLLWVSSIGPLPANNLLRGVQATTAPDGVASFSDLAVRNGYPGNFTVVVTARGSSSAAISITTPMAVASLTPERANCSSFRPATTSIYGLEHSSGGRSVYTDTQFIGEPLTCYSEAADCVPAGGGPSCSGHGTCQCGVCFCEPGWLGAVDCSAPTLGNAPRTALLERSLPVLGIRRAVPGFILGSVTVRDGQHQLMSNYSVQAHLVRCGSGALVDEARLAIGSYCTPLLQGGDVVSSPSDANGAATFAYYPVFVTSVPPGCYAFKYSFYSTSERNMLANTLYSPGKGTVWSKATSQPFMIASEVVSVNTTRAPSRVVAAGSVLPIQPAFTIHGNLGNTAPFPSQVAIPGCHINRTGPGAHCQPSLVQSSTDSICPPLPSIGDVATYVTVAMRRMDTGEVIRIGEPGNHGMCLLLTASELTVFTVDGRRRIRAEFSFQNLRIPAAVPVAQLTRRSYDMRPFPAGSYELLIEISGIILRTGALVQVTSSVYSMDVDHATATAPADASLPTAVPVSEQLPRWNVTAFAAPGVVISDAIVTSSLLALDAGAPLWQHLGNSIAGTPNDTELGEIATRLADAVTLAERRRKVEATSRLLGADVPASHEAPDIALMTSLGADVYRSLPFLTDATQTALDVSDTGAMSASTDTSGVATVGSAPVVYGRTGVYLIRVTSPRASALSPGVASSLVDANDPDTATSLLQPASLSSVTQALSTPAPLGSTVAEAASECQVAQTAATVKSASAKTVAKLSILSAVTGNTTVFLPIVIRNPVDRFVVTASPNWPEDLKPRALEIARQVAGRGGNGLFANPALAITDEPADVSARVCARDAAGQPMPQLSLTLHIDRPIRSSRPPVIYTPLSGIKILSGLPASRTVVTDAQGCVSVGTLRLVLSGVASEQVALRFESKGVYSTAVNVTLLTFADANPWSVQDLTAALFYPAAIVSPLMVANTLYSDLPAARIASAAAGLASVAFLSYIGITEFYSQQQQIQELFDPRFARYVILMDYGFAAFCASSFLFIIGVVSAHLLHPALAPCCRRCRESCRRRSDWQRRRPGPPWLSTASDAAGVARVATWRSVASADFVEYYGFAPVPSLWRGPQFTTTKAKAFTRYAASVAPRSHVSLMEQDGRLSLAAVDALHDIYDRYIAAGRAAELVAALQGAARDAVAAAARAPLMGDAVRGMVPPSAGRARKGGMVTSPLESAIARSGTAETAPRVPDQAPTQAASLGASDADARSLLVALESEGYARLASDALSRADFVEWFAARLRLAVVWPRPPPSATRFVEAARTETRRMHGRWCSLQGSKLGSAARRVLAATRGSVLVRDRVVWAQLRALGFDSRLRREIAVPCPAAAPPSAARAVSMAEPAARERRCIDVHRLWRPCAWRLTPAGSTALGEAMGAWVGADPAGSSFEGLDYAATKSFFRHAGAREPEYRMYLHACSLSENGEEGGEPGNGKPGNGKLQPHQLLACVAQRRPLSAKEELSRLLRAHGFNEQLIRGPSRRPSPPFFFPQRMLIGALLSAMAVALMVLWTDSLAVRLAMLVDELWTKANEFQDVAARMAKEALKKQVEAAQSRAFRTVAGADGSPAANAVDAAMSSAAAQQFAASTEGGQGPGLGDSLYDVAGDNVRELIYMYSGRVLARVEPVKDAFKAKFHSAATVAAVSSVCIMVLCWALMLVTFRQRVLAARRGSYTMQWHKNQVGQAVNYAGLMMSLSGLGYLMSWFPLVFIVFVFMWEQSRAAIVNLVTNTLASLIGLSLVITIAQHLLMKLVLVRDNHIQQLRGFLLADVFFSLFQLFKGLFVALTRLIFVVAFFGLTFARSDVSQLPAEQEHQDVATSAYNAMLMVEAMYNHPLKWAFQRTLINRLKAKRTLRKARRSNWDSIRSAITGRVELTQVTRHKRLDESPPLTPAPAPPSPPASPALPAAAHRSTAATADPARPFSQRAKIPLHCDRSMISDAASPRQRVIRNKWNLLVVLSRNPSLTQHRRRDGLHQYDSLWPRVALHRDALAPAAGDARRQRELAAFDGRLLKAARRARILGHSAAEPGSPAREEGATLAVKPISRSHPLYFFASLRRGGHEAWQGAGHWWRRSWQELKRWLFEDERHTTEYGRL